ncbi:MAG TPA: GNAT family N-acetyltransferase [bacterium]|nr:GNAT family N-acetyltransferase [bacterium]
MAPIRLQYLEDMKREYPGKFAPEKEIFKNITRGDRIFIGTGCGEPQYLVNAMINYVQNHPKAFFDAEVFHVWTLDIAPYTSEKYKSNFRHNSFFIGNTTRDTINRGISDYTPIFLSRVPDLFKRKIVPIDIALIQVSPTDSHGHMSLGVSVDITKSAVENAKCIIAQVNPRMPRVHGDTFIHISDIDYIIPFDEELIEYKPKVSDDIANRIGEFVSGIIQDGDTIQTGYGSVPNAIMSNLHNKNDLGVHTELFTEGIADLMRKGIINNSRKSILRGKAVASFCMGTKDTYDFIHDNPSVEFRPVDYVNSPLVIARNRSMVAINSGLQIDLSGQASVESIGRYAYSGIGGSADFMRGAALSPGGKNILVLQSTARNGEVSRIVPFLDEGGGVALGRGDIQYVVTEYGIAYLHGKSIRERAMALISIAHPKFRADLIDRAKYYNLIYKDQAFIPGKRGEYPEHLETYRKTRKGLEILFRPVKISDETLLKDFFYSLSDNSLYRRFVSARKDMPHERLQEFVIIDYTEEMVVLASLKQDEKEIIVGMGQYMIYSQNHTAEVAFAVLDEYQDNGIGTELLDFLTVLATKQGLLGLGAEVLAENKPMLHVFDKAGFDIVDRNMEGMVELRKMFGPKE